MRLSMPLPNNVVPYIESNNGVALLGDINFSNSSIFCYSRSIGLTASTVRTLTGGSNTDGARLNHLDSRLAIATTVACIGT